MAEIFGWYLPVRGKARSRRPEPGPGKPFYTPHYRSYSVLGPAVPARFAETGKRA